MNKKTNPDIFNDYMKEIKPDTYTQTKNLICDWSDKKLFDSLKDVEIYVRHCMIVDKAHII